MTLSQMTSRVRYLARVSSSSHDDTELMYRINDGMTEFAKDIHGLDKEGYVTIQPKFDSRTNWGLNMSGNGGDTTFAVTSTDRDDATGGTIASDLQTSIQAATTAWSSATVTWSTTDWTFAITVPSATTVTISSPVDNKNYLSAVEYLLGTGNTQATTTWTSSLPEDCTVEADLPSDYVAMHYVEWDNREMYQAGFDLFASPGYTGNPMYWHVRNRKLRLYPNPARQKMLKIWYKATPADFVDAATQASVACPLPDIYHIAPCYWAAAQLAEEGFEGNIADRMQRRYADQVRKYTLEYSNENPKMYSQNKGFLHPRITLSRANS
jgi:hypothetical protein